MIEKPIFIRESSKIKIGQHCLFSLCSDCHFQNPRLKIRFSEFSRLIVSDKYVKIYRDSSHLMSWFNVILFVVQIVSFAFFHTIGTTLFWICLENRLDCLYTNLYFFRCILFLPNTLSKKSLPLLSISKNLSNSSICRK